MTTKAKINYQDYKTLPELIRAVKSAGLAANLTEARQGIASMIPKESKFQEKILKYLRELKKSGKINAVIWKEQAGGGYQINGLPDVMALINGKLYGFEVKRPFIGKVSEIQQKRIDEMNAAGGHTYVVSYASEVKEILEHDGVI